jgi:hypothetical protein
MINAVDCAEEFTKTDSELEETWKLEVGSRAAELNLDDMAVKSSHQNLQGKLQRNVP